MVSSFAVDPKLLDSADLPALRRVFSEDVVGKLQPNGEGRFVWLKRKVSGEEAQKILALNIRAVRDIGEQGIPSSRCDGFSVHVGVDLAFVGFEGCGDGNGGGV